MHEDLIGGVYDHRANPEYPKYPNISAYCAYSCILVIAYWPPAMGIGEHEGSMSRHIILTAILCLLLLPTGLMAIWHEL